VPFKDLKTPMVKEGFGQYLHKFFIFIKTIHENNLTYPYEKQVYSSVLLVYFF